MLITTLRSFLVKRQLAIYKKLQNFIIKVYKYSRSNKKKKTDLQALAKRTVEVKKELNPKKEFKINPKRKSP